MKTIDVLQCSGTWFRHCIHSHTHLMSHETQNREDDKPSNKAGPTVEQADPETVPGGCERDCGYGSIHQIIYSRLQTYIFELHCCCCFRLGLLLWANLCFQLTCSSCCYAHYSSLRHSTFQRPGCRRKISEILLQSTPRQRKQWDGVISYISISWMLQIWIKLKQFDGERFFMSNYNITVIGYLVLIDISLINSIPCKIYQPFLRTLIATFYVTPW